MDKVNLQVIRESFGRVAYSHKTHEKVAEIENFNTKIVKWANIILISLTSGSLITTIITNNEVLIYTSATLSTIALGFTIFQLSFDPQSKAHKHKNLAKELWYIREKYVNLIADITNNKLNEKSILSRRDQLIEELKLIYRFAPPTSSKAYKKARKALKINEELTFSNKEINDLLPNKLKIK